MSNDVRACLMALLMLALVLLAATFFPAVERLVDERPDFYAPKRVQHE